jgi:predicted membrane channel-forming protein YqfA (hemolysin III family)
MSHQGTAGVLATVGVLTATGLTAWSHAPERALPLWGYLSTGPVAGVLVAAMSRRVREWVPMVVVTTAVSVAPIIKALRATDPTRVFIWWVVAGLLWYVTGFLYIIGIWV